MVAERVFDRLRWVWGCVAVWFYGAFVAVDGPGRGLGVRCGRVDVRRTLIVGAAVCSPYAALSELPFASLRDAGDLQGGPGF